MFRNNRPFDRQFIGGVWKTSTSGRFIEVENPTTREVFAKVPEGTPEDVDRAVAAAREAFEIWRRTPKEERIALVERMLAIFEGMADEIVDLEVAELGCPSAFARATHCDYQMTRIRSYIACAKALDFTVPSGASLVKREPVGVAAAITPWNYPLGQVVQKVIPAVLAGCSVVLKPSQHTPLTAVLLMQAFEAAGAPAGLVNLVQGRGASLGEYLASHPGIDMVSFTGSTKVGRHLAAMASGRLKHVSLELGGKSPFVWLKGLDWEPAARKLCDSVLLNSGQTCTALSRLVVPEDELETVKAVLLKLLPEYPVGDPKAPGVRIGPLSSAAQYRKVADYIRIGLEEGAEMIAGRIPAPLEELTCGYFIEPVIFANVTNDMRIAREEIFGPVISILTYKTVDEAVRIANDTPYGLNAAVWGPKVEALAVAERIEAGNVYVNDGPRDVDAPFGGYKESGIGREGGWAGILEFTQLKTIFEHGSL